MRVLWFVAGTAAGVYATAKVRRAAETLTVDGMHDRLTGWFAGARVLREELRTGMAEKETELRPRHEAVAHGPDGLEGPDGSHGRGAASRQLQGRRHLELTENGRDDH
jgi:hypothetical protein